MKYLRLALVGAALLFSGWQPSRHSRPACRPGELTHFAVERCVNVWPSDDAKFRWPDLDASCDPRNPTCDSAKVMVAKTLQAADCLEVRVLRILPGDHLAEVHCRNLDPDQTGDYFVNLDSLACNPANVAHYGSPGPAAAPGSTVAKEPGISARAGLRILARAEARMREMQSAVAKDTQVILQLVLESDPAEFYDRVKAAREEIGELLLRVQERQKLDPDCEPLRADADLSDDQVRAQRTCRLLHSSSDVGSKLLEAASQRAASQPPPSANAALGLALKEEAGRAVSAPGSYAQAGALATRMLIFYALRGEAPDLPSRLKLIRRSVETGARDPADESKPYFWELHSGFVFGGRRLARNSGGGYDCSDFMASILGQDGRASEPLSTWKLKNIARYLSGEIPRSALSASSRRLASCFSAVDIRAGERPQPGDFVISNNESLKDGHATIVKESRSDGVIVTIEDSGGSANTIMSKARPLFEPQPSCPVPESRLPVRPDLHVLRLKSPQPASCPLEVPSASGD